MFSYSLKNKLIFTIVGIVSVLGLIATYTVFSYSKNILYENEKESLLLIATEQAQQVSILLKQSTDLSEIISQQEFILDYLNDSEKEFQDLKILEKLKTYNINNIYSSIYLMDLKGTTLVSTAESFVSKNYSFREYFKGALQGENFTDISVGATSKELGYYFSTPVRNTKSKIIGVLVLKMKPEVIDNLIINPYIESNRNKLDLLAVIDNHSVIFHSNHENQLFKSIADLNPLVLSEISEQQRFADYKISPLNYSITLEEIKEAEKFLSTKIFNKISKENFLLNIVKIQGYPFCMVVIENENKLITSALDISYNLGIFVLLSVILASFFVNFIVRNLTKPLIELNSVVKKASDGDLGQRVLISSKDDIGILGNNFNKLIEKLQKNLKEVEAKVSLRTKQLEKTNQAMTGREIKMIELKKEMNELKNKEKL